MVILNSTSLATNKQPFCLPTIFVVGKSDMSLPFWQSLVKIDKIQPWIFNTMAFVCFCGHPIGTNGKKKQAFFHPEKLGSSSCKFPKLRPLTTPHRWNFPTPTHPTPYFPVSKPKLRSRTSTGFSQLVWLRGLSLGKSCRRKDLDFFHWVGMAWEEGSFPRCGERRFDTTVVSWEMILKLDV